VGWEYPIGLWSASDRSVGRVKGSKALGRKFVRQGKQLARESAFKPGQKVTAGSIKRRTAVQIMRIKARTT
jgi:hypothetical protein